MNHTTESFYLTASQLKRKSKKRLGSNMRAECLAFLDSLKLIMQYGLGNSQFLFESDSHVLVHMVTGKTEVPWRLQRILEETWSLLKGRQYQMSHCIQGS
ncbi:unnamed protein product [Ilex paraguariensis]|uniref:RNase H type-1 domain-containing protein n=1 Tax=Ilex paraguariensis TaxID=185542 RepID=A0ABC8RA79_9AQUA